GRVIEVDGAPRAHVLDPRTGAPATGARYAAAVLPAGEGARESPGDAGARADAWSTALLVCADRPPGAASEALTSLILPAPISPRAPGGSKARPRPLSTCRPPAASPLRRSPYDASGPPRLHRPVRRRPQR